MPGILPDESVNDLLHRMNMLCAYQAQWCRRFDHYYGNTQPISLLPDDVKKACGDRLPEVRVAFCQLAIDAIEERLNIIGHRLPGDENASEVLWEIWVKNQLDEFSQQGHLDALVHGRCFVLVWVDDKGYPRITVESARSAAVWSLPGKRRRLAGIKRWVEPSGHARCTLFLPDRILMFESPTKIAVDPQLQGAYSWYGGHYDSYDYAAIPPSGWVQIGEVRNGLAVVPLIPIANRPRLQDWGSSELLGAIPLTDALVKLQTDLMVASEFYATPRRYVTGIEIQTRINPETGKEEVVDPFQVNKTRNLLAEDPETTFGQFETSLSNFAETINTITGQFGAVCSLPPHYLGISREPSSADAIRSSESPLVRKVLRKQKSFGLGWEEAMRLAYAIYLGRWPKNIEMLEVVWETPETRGAATEADAFAKKVDTGIPVEVAAQDMGYSPTAIDDMSLADIAAAQDSPALNSLAPAWETDRAVRRDGQIGR